MNDEQIKIGDRIQLTTLPPYVKTADPMSMLRPANVLTLGEEGIIIKAHPRGYWAIRFTQACYLLESQYFQVISENG
jgi:Protein of unknown function (DUF3148)